ncbi:hypothetical protein BP5796_01392 [Coleophoma crateriformis]|uniref:Peptidase S8/S53 domain-containing protein n=1 Tax=Coleophoma crateriformis TaxID=565419 RepID=A0A3D8T1X6_9HELO|nr:hypothetical protein BP5796_01392 [Coleophoma crateriformis]
MKINLLVVGAGLYALNQASPAPLRLSRAQDEAIPASTSSATSIISSVPSSSMSSTAQTTISSTARSSTKPTATTPTKRTVVVPAGQASTQMVFPIESIQKGASCEALFGYLDSLLGANQYYATYLSGMGVQFISVAVTAEQIDEIKERPDVQGVVADEPLDGSSGAETPLSFIPAKTQVIPTATPTSIANAEWEQQTFIQAPGTPLSDYPNYTVSVTDGMWGMVYVVDSGYDITGPEARVMFAAAKALQPEWIYAGTERLTGTHDYTDNASNKHGTCMVSKINGEWHGVTQRSSMIIVKRQRTLRDSLDGLFWAINDDIGQNGRRWSVITTPDVYQNPVDPLVIKVLERFTEETINQGTPFIVPAGDDYSPGGPADVNTYPQLLNEKYPIIVVGAVDINGNNATFSKGGPLVNVMAPGVNSTCAFDSVSDQVVSGTSYAAAYATGWISYMVSEANFKELKIVNQVAISAQELMSGLAYPRVPGGGRVLYRGVTGQCDVKGSTKCSNSAASTTVAVPGSLDPTTVITSREELKDSKGWPFF